MVGFIAVLDGAPERAHYQSCCRKGTDGLWAEKVKAKDSTFFQYCRDTLGLHKAGILEAGTIRPYTDVLEEDRAFQDACIGLFEGDMATCNAISAALHIRTFLTSLTYEWELAWHEQLHPRIAIASVWEATLRGILAARRDEIIVERDLFGQLERCHQRDLLAARVRPISSAVS